MTLQHITHIVASIVLGLELGLSFNMYDLRKDVADIKALCRIEHK